MNKFYGIGLGPGDPELMTIKSQKILERVKYIIVPKSKENSMAKQIIKKYIKNDNIIEVEFPMGENNEDKYKNVAQIIKDNISHGDIAFVTLGDPMTYSTFIYVFDQVKKFNIESEIIPGISAYSASAAKLNIPITVKGESAYICEKLPKAEVLEYVDTICIFKGNKNKKEILEILESRGFKVYMVKRVGLKEEEILINKEDIINTNDYMSIIIGKK